MTLFWLAWAALVFLSGVLAVYGLYFSFWMLPAFGLNNDIVEWVAIWLIFALVPVATLAIVICICCQVMGWAHSGIVALTVPPLVALSCGVFLFS